MHDYSFEHDDDIQVAARTKTLPNGRVRGEWVCIVGNGEDVIDGEVEANARLIAAAPDILAENIRLRKRMGELAQEIEAIMGEEAQNISGDSYHALANMAAELEVKNG